MGHLGEPHDVVLSLRCLAEGVAVREQAAPQANSYWQRTREKKKGALVLNYRSLRNAIGLIGAGFPIVLFVGAEIYGQWPESVSGYYFTPMRNVLVGALCAVGVFLMAYSGYNNLDRWITNLAGFFALGVAFCPTANPNFHPHWVSYLHHIFSSLMMIFLALMALQFTRTESSHMGDLPTQLRSLWRALLGRGLSPEAKEARHARDELERPEAPNERVLLEKIVQKYRRNRIFISCAWLILIWIACALLQNLIKQPTWHLFFFCEVFALWTFAVSWFAKGQLLRLLLRREET